MTREEWSRSWKPWLRGTAIGFPIGAMPAGGAEIPTFLSYYAREEALQQARGVRHDGAIEGVAGPEAANNASAAGVLVPMLTLGLPTSATAAIMLSAFQSYGINPGPLLLQHAAAAGLGADRHPVHRQRDAAGAQPADDRAVGEDAARSRAPLLYAGILVFATIGTYGISQSPIDLVLLYIIGVHRLS